MHTNIFLISIRDIKFIILRWRKIFGSKNGWWCVGHWNYCWKKKEEEAAEYEIIISNETLHEGSSSDKMNFLIVI